MVPHQYIRDPALSLLSLKNTKNQILVLLHEVFCSLSSAHLHVEAVCSWEDAFSPALPTGQCRFLLALYSRTLDLPKMMTVRLKCWLSALIWGCLRPACLLYRQTIGPFTAYILRNSSVFAHMLRRLTAFYEILIMAPLYYLWLAVGLKCVVSQASSSVPDADIYSRLCPLLCSLSCLSVHTEPRVTSC